MDSQELIELEEMLERQIKRRDKEKIINGFPSKKTTDQISKTRQLIKLFSKETIKTEE
jgi:hypothetical protein